VNLDTNTTANNL